MSQMQVLIPLAGRSPFFPPEHYFFPKSLIEVGGRPMIERAIENLRGVADDAMFIFVVQHEEVARYSLGRTLKLLTNERCRVVTLRNPTKGALCSALMAIDHLDMDQPLVIANGDQVIEADLAGIVAGFRQKQAQAGVIVFDSVHPRWSYADLDASGNVQQTAEKQVLSRNATAGFYYFDSGRRFVTAAQRCIENDAKFEGQFFISPCLNEIILEGGLVASHRIAVDAYHSFYSPEKISQYEDTTLRRSLTGRAADPMSEVRVVIPAAGEGTRFRKAGYARPKPFIDVLGRPMIEHVIQNVAPRHAHVHVLLRKEHIASELAAVTSMKTRGHVIHEVDRLTEGTACTLLLARAAFDDDKPVLVANSDQYVDFSTDAFVRDCLDRNLDGSILVFKDAKRRSEVVVCAAGRRRSGGRSCGEEADLGAGDGRHLSVPARVGLRARRRRHDRPQRSGQQRVLYLPRVQLHADAGSEDRRL